MRKRALTAILTTVMALSIVGCGSTVEPQPGSQTAETSQINYQKDLKALGFDRHYGGSIGFNDGQLVNNYFEGEIDKVQVVTKEPTYTSVEIGNIQEGNKIKYDLVATRLDGKKEFYTYSYIEDSMLENFMQIDEVDLQDSVSLEKIDDTEFRLYLHSEVG